MNSPFYHASRGCPYDWINLYEPYFYHAFPKIKNGNVSEIFSFKIQLKLIISYLIFHIIVIQSLLNGF